MQEGLIHNLARGKNTPQHLMELVISYCNIDLKNEADETALMVAMEHNNNLQAIVLLDFGADLFPSNQFGESCLHIACRKVTSTAIKK